MKSSLMRARWAAVGAAVAVSLGAGAVMVANAVTPTGTNLVYVSIPTCRIMDTRNLDNVVGPDVGLISRLGNGTVNYVDIDAVGNGVTCSGIPTSGVAAVNLNVTAVNPSAASFLLLFPGDLVYSSPQSSSPLLGSNVNFESGDGPTANQAVVRLGTAAGPNDGVFGIYNHDGAVDVVIDVNGYYLKNTAFG